jgi:Protein of unknown function (DUF3225)
MLSADDINRPDVVGEVRAAFDAYEAALVDNNVALLNDFFVDRPDTVRFGIAEQAIGYDAIRAWRAGAQPVPASRKLLRVTVVTLGRSAASVCAEFVLPPSVSLGRQTQTWARIDALWKIVAAHVSVIVPN